MRRLAAPALLLIVAAAIGPLEGWAAGGRPDIRVAAGSWGGGEPDEIGQVVAAVAELFPPPAGQGATTSIRIRHRFGGPLIQYDRDPDGSIVMYLSARDSRWYQYVYQFAHEYCHLLARFDRKQRGQEIVREHQWFEEALCETASLYALRRLAERWCQSPPGPQFREAAAQFSLYLRQLLAEPHRTVGAGAPFRDWYERQRGALQREPYLRELNEAVAVQLLPLFDKDPRRWAALSDLHPEHATAGGSFADLLAAWRAAVPPDLGSLVDDIGRLFGTQPVPPEIAAGPTPAASAPSERTPDCGG